MHVLFGSALPIAGGITTADSRVHTLDGSYPHAWFGAGMDTRGDWDGDGLADLLVGAGASSGAFVFTAAELGDFGGGPVVDDADLKLQCTEGGLFGNELAWVPDLDGDGRSEIAVGAPNHTSSLVLVGAVRVFLSTEVSGYATQADAAVTLLGGDAWDLLTRDRGVEALPDLDGDGLPELLLGASHVDGITAAAAGGAYIVSGATVLAGGTHAVHDVAISHFEPTHDEEGLGRILATLPDLDGNGLPELGIASPYWPDPSARQGRFAIVMP